MRTKFHRWSVLLSLLTAFALTVAACAPQESSDGGGGSSSAEGEPQQGGTVVFGAEQEPAGSLNSDLAASSLFWGAMIMSQVIEGAYEVQPDFTYEPNLIDGEAEVDEGPPFTVTYNILEEAQWSDGTPVTADDFEFTLDTILDPKVDIATTDGYDLITKTEIVDDKTITFTFKEPFAPYKEIFNHIYPKHAIEGEDFNKVWTNCICDKQGEPIGTGPFLITDYKKGSELTTSRNEEYWGEHKAYLDEVVWRFTTDTNTEIQSLRGEEVDLIYPQPQLELTALEEVPGVEIISGFGATWEHVDFQQKNPLLAERFVRQAISYGIDRDAIVERLLQKINPDSEVLQNLIYVANQDEYEPHFQTYDFDPDKATQLLEDNGCTEGSGGIYECNGEPLSFGFKSTSGNALRELTFEVIQQQLKEVGIEVNSEFGEADIVFTDLAERKYDIFMFAWVGSADPFSGNTIWECGGDQNYQGSCEPEATKLLKQTTSILDPAERADVYNQADAIMAEDVPVLPLYQKPTYLAYFDKLHNIEDNATNEGPFFNSEDWWIDE